ncbi:MFS transporter [Clostridium gelidum]|uniref:MFS transporter n=1 Tax=Clostridium gelidum TaxID=704125 RepID=A0ABM7TAN8_9CLOT|nr:MFS transporter [Clostridium gelidum]BCZ48381.1 MFS transporter [Clostridium gelidum]
MNKLTYTNKYLTKLKNQEFINIILLISGEFVSTFGTRIYNFAIAYYILQTTGSALAFSISLALGTIPRILISPFAGAIVDALDRKKIVIFMDLGRWITLLALYFIAVLSNIQIIHIYITILFLSTMDIFFNIASGSSIPNIVHKKNIIKINSIKQTLSSLGSILAPSIGGIVISFISIKYFIIINAFSFLISGISQYFINYNINNTSVFSTSNKTKLSVNSILQNTKESIGYIKTQSLIIILTIYSMVGNFLIYLGFVIPMPYLVLKCFNLGSTQYGIIQSGISIGAVIAAILLSIIPLPEKKFKLVMYSSLVFCAPFILLGIGAIMNMIHISKSILFVYMVVVTFMYGSGTVLINVPTNAIQQENIENSYLGRVLGFQNTFGGIITPVSMILSGKLIGMVAPYILPLISGVMFIILVIVTCSNRTMKAI